MARASLELSLLRTFSIPSISKILAATRQFDKDPGKRYEDTELIIREIIEHPFDSERSDLALRRLNMIHGNYNISNDDFLYVLSTFIVAPSLWLKEHDWFDDASYVHGRDAGFYCWRKIGKRMGIKDIPTTFDEFARWTEAYEKEHMVYAATNRAVAEASYRVFENYIPRLAVPLMRRFTYCIFDDRMREALGYPRQPAWAVALAHSVLKARSFLAWHLLPPRPEWLRERRTGKEKDADGFYHPGFYVYNIKVYCPRGYKIEELGPAHLPPGKLAKLHAGASVKNRRAPNVTTKADS